MRPNYLNLSDSKILQLKNRDYIWNFAYGSNMNPSKLAQRAQIKSLESIPGILFDWKLTFNLPGIKFIEPSMANIEPALGYQVHGVLIKLRQQQFDRLILSEGGNQYYQLIPCSIQTYDARVIEALVFKVKPDRTVKYEIPPSKRYLELIKQGAKLNNLDSQYRQWLSNLAYEDIFPPFDLLSTVIIDSTFKLTQFPLVSCLLDKIANCKY